MNEISSREARTGFVTLTTDFGLADGYAGVLRGVIWGIAPQAQIADLSHAVSPQNILQGALILLRHWKYFPPGTVHVGVIDPGVGTPRRPIAAHLDDHFFVGPDNGLCSLMLGEVEKAGGHIEIVHLDKPQYWLAQVSNVFQARDIFAPAAAHLLNGVSLQELGTLINDSVRLHLPAPSHNSSGWFGEILYVDGFGNLATNLRRDHLGDAPDIEMAIKGEWISRYVRAYGEAEAGQLVLLIGSSGYLEVARVNGNAAQLLQAGPGEPVEIRIRGTAR